MDLKVWQEDGSGQECHTGSGLQLDFPFVPLAQRAESWQGGCGGDDGGKRSLSQGHAAALGRRRAPPLSVPQVLGGGQSAEFLHLSDIWASNLTSIHMVNGTPITKHTPLRYFLLRHSKTSEGPVSKKF